MPGSDEVTFTSSEKVTMSDWVMIVQMRLNHETAHILNPAWSQHSVYHNLQDRAGGAIKRLPGPEKPWQHRACHGLCQTMRIKKILTYLTFQSFHWGVLNTKRVVFFCKVLHGINVWCCRPFLGWYLFYSKIREKKVILVWVSSGNVIYCCSSRPILQITVLHWNWLHWFSKSKLILPSGTVE